MCVQNAQGLYLWVSWNGMGEYNSPDRSGTRGSVDRWVPFSITSAHNCGLSSQAPDYQRFTEAVNTSDGWQTQAELGFIALGDREALLTYNRYGPLPGPPPPGCPGQAPCDSIAFSMRVSFAENATEAPCVSATTCPTAEGVRLATEFCQSAVYQGPRPGQDCPGGNTNATTRDWLALKSGPGTPSRWRCYAPSTLNSNHTAYRAGRDFCSESAILEDIVNTCKLPPIPGPPPSPPSPAPVLPFNVATTPPNGDILVRNAFMLPTQFAVVDRQEPVFGSVNGDYKPSIAQLNNSDILIVFRTHPQSGPLHAVFLRSQDNARSWVRDESQTHLTGNEFALHSLSDGTVLLTESGNGTYAPVYRSTDWGHSFRLSQTIECQEMAWSVLEENGTFSGMPHGVYLLCNTRTLRIMSAEYS